MEPNGSDAEAVLGICILEDFIATAVTIAVVLFFGHSLLALFDATPEVIFVGYTRLVMVFSAYTFSMLYEVMSGYLRGFGISLVPALLTVIGVVGVRITWIAFVFPAHRTFEAIMIVYPIQPRRNRRTHRHRSALLPSVQAIRR